MVRCTCSAVVCAVNAIAAAVSFSRQLLYQEARPLKMEESEVRRISILIDDRRPKPPRSDAILAC